ncbi:hypothetical protein F5B22DRAFT_625660 [Xylaria bambusicola]|uniref:uncharacterized protein n=1 Tax=Xylaria bambusicola TaxID=326684 RepID=UPI002007B91D|nr:uncharacterized protein F5B22DRAFT_625660 [Xylaria bambusicola]KAI0505978.1 hypothetical protein F5B22DRAFT_625660 [Xylaria bambusicola]
MRMWMWMWMWMQMMVNNATLAKGRIGRMTRPSNWLLLIGSWALLTAWGKKNTTHCLWNWLSTGRWCFVAPKWKRPRLLMTDDRRSLQVV